VLPEIKLALLGVIATLTFDVACETVTVALERWVGSATLVAVTVTLVLASTLGAENSPLAEMTPALVDHVTAVFDVPCTRAENCCVVPEVNEALFGEIITLTMGVDVLETVICRRRVAVIPRASVAVTRKYLTPVTLGVPVIAPAEPCSVRPVGSDPSATVK
jgi:hypothetical protein